MGLQIEIRMARRHSEVLACQYLIAEVYNRHYDIVFSRDEVDLNAKIEPYPHRYVMGVVGSELVAAAGLYTSNTYVDRYGGIGGEELERALVEAGVPERVRNPHREYTKLVVRQGWEGKGIGRFFFAVTHSRDFIVGDGDVPLLLSCAKLSVFRSLYDVAGIRTRILRPFPNYRVHELYRTENDPMDSRLIVPDLDIDPRWYNRRLPDVFEVESFGGPDVG
jgi:hypothetical protein